MNSFLKPYRRQRPKVELIQSSRGGSAILIALGVLLVSICEVHAGLKIKRLNPTAVFLPANPIAIVAAEHAKRELSKLKDRYKNPEDFFNVCKQLENDAQSARAVADTTRKSFLSQLNVAPIPKEGVVLFNIHGRASFTYNAYAGTSGYNITLPTGIEVEKGKLKSSLSGKYSVPNIDPTKIIANTGFIRVNLVKGYDDWVRKKVKSDRYVYVASKRFVDMLSERNVAQEVGWAILTAGKTAEGSIEALKEQLVLEWTDIITWLRQVGEQKSEEAARDIAEAILKAAQEAVNGSKFDVTKLRKPELPPVWKGYDLDVDLGFTDYEYVATSPVLEKIAGILSLIGYKNKKAIAKPPPEKHLVFSISINKKPSFDPQEKLREFIDRLQKQPEEDFGLLGDKVSGQIEFGNVARLLKDGSEEIRAAFAEALSNTADASDGRYDGSGVFNYTNSNAVTWLEGRLRSLAIGNNGDAQVKRLVVDVASQSVSVDVELTHKHVLSKQDILKALNAGWGEADRQFNSARGKLVEQCSNFKNDCRKLTLGIKIVSQICDRVFDVKPLEPSDSPVALLTSPPGSSNLPDQARWRPIAVCPDQNDRSLEGDAPRRSWWGDDDPPVAFNLYPWPPKPPYAPKLTLAESVKLHLDPPVALGTEVEDGLIASGLKRGVAIQVPIAVNGTFDVVAEELLRCNRALKIRMEILLQKNKVFGLRFAYESTTDDLIKPYSTDAFATYNAPSQFLSHALSAIITTAGLNDAKIIKQSDNEFREDVLLTEDNRVLVYTRRISDTGVIRPGHRKIYKFVETLYYGPTFDDRPKAVSGPACDPAEPVGSFAGPPYGPNNIPCNPAWWRR
ncbi:hypothetical protein [Bradyrhizobium japonicum]|uniref:hypothetical protein n=1 Tax=Bradyrhizobium japonicum TaxID=375 RepID=UPI0004B2DEE9|nr:hypothetical protein [Bradyrhizobium japonicum]